MFISIFIKYRRALGAAVVASAAIQMLSLSGPLALMTIIDRVLVSRNTETLTWVVGAYLLTGLAAQVLTFMNQRVITELVAKVSSELAGRFFRHVVRLPYDYFCRTQIGEIIYRKNEIDNVKGVILEWTVSEAVELAFVVIFWTILWSMSPLLSCVVLASIPFALVEYFILGKYLRNRLTDAFHAGVKMDSSLIEVISLFETIKSNSKESWALESIEGHYSRLVHSNYKTQILQAFSSGYMGIVSVATDASVIFLGISAVIDGKLTVGAYLAFTMLAGRVTAPVLKLARMWERIIHLKISLERLGDVFSQEPEVEGIGHKPDRLKGKIEFDQVKFSYSRGNQVLNGMNFQIAPGEIVCVVGESGSGKSTLTKMFSRLLRPDSGRVLVDGHSAEFYESSSLRSRIAYVIQDASLFKGTVEENISLGMKRVDPIRIREAARLACAEAFIENLPDGYAFELNERGSNLSGGQRQRIALARAIASDADILVFDEATSALDYETEFKIISELRQMSRGRTVVFVTHRLSVARLADKILVVKDGQVTGEGKHEKLASQNEAYARLCTYGALV